MRTLTETKAYQDYERSVVAWCRINEIDRQTIDYQADFDSGINSRENFNNFLEKYSSLANQTLKEVKKQVAEAEVEQQKHFREIEQEVQRKEQEALATIVDNKAKDIDKYYTHLKELIKTMLNSDINGLLVLGEAGWGKSFQVNKFLLELGKKPTEDFAVLSSYSTPLEFFKFLYHNQEKVIILDDLLKLLDNDISKGILLSALWSIGKNVPRVVNYSSSSSKLDVPSSFEFKGKIIWCLNKVPKDLEPMLSRIYKHEINFSYADKIEIIASLCNVLEMDAEVFDFVKKYTNEATPNLSLRLPIKINELKKNSTNWKKISKTQIDINEELLLVAELQEQAITEKEKILKFIRETGRSRRTYFRLKAKLGVKK